MSERIWKFNAVRDVVDEPVVCGDVLVISTAENIRGVDLYTGEERWSHSTTNPGGVHGVVTYGSSIYFLGYTVDYSSGGSSGNSGNSGNSGWGSGQGNGNGNGNNGWGPGGGAATIALIGLNVGTGKYLDNWSAVSKAITTPKEVLVESDVLVIRDDEKVYGYDANPSSDNSLPLWTVDWKSIVANPADSPGPVGVGNGAIFFVAGAQLLGVNVRSGEVRWRFDPPGGDTLPQNQPPQVGNKMVIVAGHKSLYALDWTSGKEKWNYGSGSQSWNTPVVSWDGGCVFATSPTSNEAVGLATENGEAFWNSTLSDLAGSSPVAGQSGGHLLKPLINTDVVEQDIESGHLLRENRVFLPASTGAVFIVDVTTNNTEAPLAPQQRLTATVNDDVVDVKGLKFSPQIGNGTLLLSDANSDDAIQAWAYTAHLAAYFDGGGTSMLSAAKSDSYALEGGDFSLESWVRTSVGGDIVAQSPNTVAGSGFRLGIVNQPDGIIATNYGEGRVQFTICDKEANVVLFVQSDPTIVADGKWHHIALTRSGHNIGIYVDGINLPVTKMIHKSLVPPAELARLSKSVQYYPPNALSENYTVAEFGNSAEPVTIGAYSPSATAFQDDNAKDYVGLIADVRIWERRLTAKQISNRMAKLLTGLEPGLLADWPLNEPDPSGFKDLKNQQAVTVTGVTSKKTNLALDDSLYPYLLNHVTSKWPYKDRWMVRSEDAPKWTPSGAGEAVCFGTDRAFFAIDLIHGTRKWGRDMSNPSGSASDMKRCVVLEDTTVRSFELEKGAQQWFVELHGQAPPSNPRTSLSSTPVLTRNCAIVSADGINVYWLNKKTGDVLGHFAAPSSIGESLYSTGTQVYMAAGGAVYRFEDLKEATPGLQPTAHASLAGSGDASLCVEGNLLFVHNGESLEAFDALTLGAPANFFWNPPNLSGQTVTGLAASSNANRLVVTTKSEVLFVDCGSGKLLEDKTYTIPDLTSPSLFPPVIHGDHVFCTAAGSGGTVPGGMWIFDLKSCDLRGREETDSPPVGAPYVASETAFFGVDDGGASSALDREALHSVVIGETLALSRVQNTPAVSVPNVDPVFDRADSGGQSPFNEGHFTVETWVNAESESVAGDLVYLPPGESSQAGFRLSLAANGQIVAEHLLDGGASKFTSQTTAAADGSWHHIAAVFRKNDTGQQLALLYLDGNPLSGVAYESLPTIPAAQSNRSLQIGGDGASAFQGLMDDVRVWGTWLHTAEIALRKNVKLLGSEPDLLAAWSFSTKSVDDASPNKLNATQDQDLDLWLTDLAFVRPNYPYMFAKSEGKDIHEKTDLHGGGKMIETADYTTGISLRKADGSPRPGTIRIWSSEPAQVKTKADSVPKPVSETSFAEYTIGDTGKLEIDLSCSDVKHSPVLWIWADYMYENERFYVSPAIASQHVIKDPPPRLVASSQMMQDYDYSPGDTLGTNTGQGKYTLNNNVDVTTIRTTITAETADGSPIPNETLEIWSNGHLQIESCNKTYDVNLENSAKFKTDSMGQVTLVMHEKSAANGNLLSTPELRVRAGWMPRSQRTVISPAENEHKTLSKVNSDQVLGSTPLDKTKPKQTLIAKLKAKDAKGATKQAPQIAKVLNQMASAGAKQNPKSNGAGAAGGTGNPTEAEYPNPDLHPADVVSLLHTLGHLPSDAPITPGYMPSKHLVLSLVPDGDNFSLVATPCDTDEDLDNTLAGVGLPNAETLFSSVGFEGDDDAAGGWFKSLGHDISHAVHDLGHDISKAWHAATHFVVKTWDEIKHDVGAVIHQVEVVVADAAKAIGKWVVKTFKDIIDHIVSFLKKIWVILKDIYEFLRALLDWKAILETRDLIENTFNHFLDAVHTAASQTIPEAVNNVFTDLKDNIAEALGADPPVPYNGSVGSQRSRMSGHGATCVSHAKSGKGQWMKQKMQQHDDSTHKMSYGPGGGAIAAPFADSPLTGVHPNINQDMEKILNDFMDILNQPGGIGAITVHEVLQVVNDIIDVVLDIMEDMILGAIKLAGAMVELIKTILNFEIKIPFISELYKLITGHDLTLLDVVSLILAIPTHVILTILGVSTPSNASTSISSSAFMAPPKGEDPAGSAQETGKFFGELYMISSVVQGIVTGFSDVVEGVAKGDDPDPEDAETSGWEKWLSIGSSFLSILTTSFQFVGRNTYFQQWEVRKYQDMANYSSIITISISFGKLVKTFTAGGEPGKLSKFLAPVTNFAEKAVSKVPLEIAGTVVGIGLLANGIRAIVVAEKKFGSDSAAYGEAAVNISSSITSLTSFLLYQPVCVATQTEVDVPVSAAAKGLIDFAVISVADTLVEGTMGMAAKG